MVKQTPFTTRLDGELRDESVAEAAQRPASRIARAHRVFSADNVRGARDELGPCRGIPIADVEADILRLRTR
ncbi:hypothetical protein [Microbacterium indicum]|uniref:hypothetical protein n=1 Tax=Microbacterium indicum TaxID=358100 RepID=UPI0012EB5AB4|nr:hypothetical protein [Microbacterium indicum]